MITRFPSVTTFVALLFLYPTLAFPQGPVPPPRPTANPPKPRPEAKPELNIETVDAEAAYFEGVGQMADDMCKEAIQSFTKVIEVELGPGGADVPPNLVKAYYNRGVCQMNGKNYSAAIDDFNRVLALDPGKPEALYNRAICYMNQFDRMKGNDSSRKRAICNAIGDFEALVSPTSKADAQLKNKAGGNLKQERGVLKGFRATCP